MPAAGHRRRPRSPRPAATSTGLRPDGGDVRGAPAGRRRRPRGSGRPAATSGQLNLPQNTWRPGSGQPEATTAGLRPAGGDVRGAPAGRRRRQWGYGGPDHQDPPDPQRTTKRPPKLTGPPEDHQNCQIQKFQKRPHTDRHTNFLQFIYRYTFSVIGQV